VGVDPRGDGQIRSTGVGVNGVLVLHGLKRDARVALVRILHRQLGHELVLEVGLVPILSDQFFANGTIHNINNNINTNINM
jgi:hypothetical protein